MNKKKIFLYSAIMIAIIYLSYRLYQSETKRMADLHDLYGHQEKSETQSTNKIIQDSENSRIEKTYPIENNSNDYTYQIVNKTEEISGRLSNCIVDIRLSRKITEGELTLLSNQLYVDINSRAKNSHYFFYLPNMTIKDIAWASALFNPDLKVEIIGQTIEDEKSIKEYVESSKDQFVGQWVDNAQPSDIINRIRKDGKNSFVWEIFSPSENKAIVLTTLKMSKKNNKTVYTNSEDRPEEYFVLEENGNLSAYDEAGFIVTYTKIK